MNAPLEHADFGKASVEAEFALERSLCIDAFAQLELYVALACQQVKIAISRDCLGRRVATLGKAKPNSCLSKANAERLTDWVGATEVLVARRAFIVHSIMTLGDFAGTWKASFANIVDVATKQPISLLMERKDLREIRRMVEIQIRELAELVKGLPPPNLD